MRISLKNLFTKDIRQQIRRMCVCLYTVVCVGQAITIPVLIRILYIICLRMYVFCVVR